MLFKLNLYRTHSHTLILPTVIELAFVVFLEFICININMTEAGYAKPQYQVLLENKAHLSFYSGSFTSFWAADW